MVGGFDLNSFRKGISLNKNYIFERMQGNETYGKYVPDNIDPRKLSRGFLLAVSVSFILFIVDSTYWCKSLSRIIFDFKKATQPTEVSEMEWL